MPKTSLRLRLNGVDYSSKLKGFSLSGGRGQPVSGTLELVDYSGHLVSEVSALGEENSNMRAHNQTPSRYYTLDAKQAGRGPTYPWLLPGDPEWDGSITRIPVTDFDPLIELENQSIDDHLYDEGDRKTAIDLLKELVAKASGIQCSPEFADYKVRDFRFANGNLVNGMNDLLQIRQAYRMWEGGLLKFRAFMKKAPVCYLQDRFHVPIGGWKHGTDVAGVKTYFKCFRLATMPSALGGPISGKDVGRVVTINFAQPTKYAVIWSRSQFGTVEDGVFFDENDTPLNTNPSFRYIGTDKEAVKWVGTYRPVFSRRGIPAYFWWVQAMGGANPDSGGGAFEVEKAVSAIEALYGRREEYSALSSEILLDEETAEAYLNAIAVESEWSVRPFDLSTPVLIPGREGDFVHCTHYKTGIAESLLLKNWSHSFAWDQGWSNTYQLAGKI